MSLLGPFLFTLMPQLLTSECTDWSTVYVYVEVFVYLQTVLLIFPLNNMEASLWQIRRSNTAHQASDDAESSRVCLVKPRLGISATISATQGSVRSAAWKGDYAR